MASKVLAQIIVYTTQVVTRAFVDAYRQAAANASRAGTAAAKQTAEATGMVGKAKTSFGGLSIAEARQILHLREHASKEEIERNFEHLFKVNEKSEGGSFYLQSKVVRAKEALDWYDSQVKMEAELTAQAEKARKEQEEKELMERARERQERMKREQEGQ